MYNIRSCILHRSRKCGYPPTSNYKSSARHTNCPAHTRCGWAKRKTALQPQQSQPIRPRTLPPAAAGDKTFQTPTSIYSQLWLRVGDSGPETRGSALHDAPLRRLRRP
eukprot:1211807-Rhodomonas_salina.2